MAREAWQPGSRLAIVGGGISGLVVAHRLCQRHDITLFEAAPRLGGHSHTVDVDCRGRRYAVDTGFIVFNRVTYPHFSALLDRLGVSSQPTTMSFSVSCQRTGLEYNGTSWNGIFAQRRNLLRPGFLRMLRDIVRFHRLARRRLEHIEPTLTLGAFLAEAGLSRQLVEHYVVPMGAAIWSAQPERILAFPARTFVRFLANHGMLSIDDRPQWETVCGGSRTYVERLVRPFRHAVRLQAPVVEVRREPDGVLVRTAGNEAERFDGVVVATHSDQALRMLTDASADEHRLLSAIPYQTNEAVLHWDHRLMPRSRRAWAAWNYRIPARERDAVTVTYHMNALQRIEAPIPLCVTLNDSGDIDPAKVLHRVTYHHPVFEVDGIRAQAEWERIAGARRTWFCGAWWRYGFHEDGTVSGLRVVGDLERRAAAAGVEVAT